MKAVIFDMDGVLIDSEPLWKIAEIGAFKKVGIDLTNTDCEETVGLRMDEVVQLWYDRVGWTGRTLKEVEDDVINILIAEIKEKGQALPGVHETLNILKAAGYKIGLATSSADRILQVVIDKLEIRSYFDILHSAEFEEYGKPHPAVFITAAKKLGVPVNQCLVIEDSFNGVLAAKAARMKVIAIPEKTHDYDQRLKISDKILDNLNGFKLDEAIELFR
ncbi:MAG: hexitol phosphatase HxpB [Crocinitomicaceae bacterium]